MSIGYNSNDMEDTTKNASMTNVGQFSSHVWEQVPPMTRFRDLVIFEERIRQNYHSLSKIRKRHNMLFISILVCVIGFVLYWLFFDISNTSPFIFTFSTILFSTAFITLLVLILLQMYSSKLAHAHKFERQIKKDLEIYNMSFNPRTDCIAFSRRVPKRWQDLFFLYREEYFRRKMAALSMSIPKRSTNRK
jgi:hypothetical protein